MLTILPFLAADPAPFIPPLMVLKYCQACSLSTTGYSPEANQKFTEVQCLETMVSGLGTPREGARDALTWVREPMPEMFYPVDVPNKV